MKWPKDNWVGFEFKRANSIYPSINLAASELIKTESWMKIILWNLFGIKCFIFKTIHFFASFIYTCVIYKYITAWFWRYIWWLLKSTPPIYIFFIEKIISLQCILVFIFWVPSGCRQVDITEFTVHCPVSISPKIILSYVFTYTRKIAYEHIPLPLLQWVTRMSISLYAHFHHYVH